MRRNPIGPKEIIDLWIEENFEEGAVEVNDYPLFPFGRHLVDCKGDNMVVYYDILRSRVEVKI